MKLLSRQKDTSKQRPYWHVDAKWVCALALIVTLAVTLPTAVAHRLTAKEPATEIVAYSLAGLTSPNGIDDTEGLEEIKARVAETGSETITFGGVDITFTAEDVNSLSPRELRLKVFKTFADNFYDRGIEGFAQNSDLSGDALEEAEQDTFLLNSFNAETHSKIGKALVWLITISLVLTVTLVFFSWRFGRLASPGLVFLLVGAPGLLFAAIAGQNPEVTGAARSEEALGYTEAASSFVSYLAPLIVPHFANVYLWVFRLGILLLVVAGIVKIIYTLRNRYANGAAAQPLEEESTEVK